MCLQFIRRPRLWHLAGAAPRSQSFACRGFLFGFPIALYLPHFGAGAIHFARYLPLFKARICFFAAFWS